MRETMDTFDSLVRVWNERFEPLGEDASCRTARLLARYLRDGPDNLRYLYDISNWDLERLRTGDYWTRFRPPRIDLIVRVEADGALVLEWQPREDLAPASRRPAPTTDFLRFANGIDAVCKFPANRLMHVPRLGELLHGSAAPGGDRRCLEAAVGLIETWARQLSVSFDVRYLTRLVLEEEPAAATSEPGRRIPLARIVDYRIYARAARKRRLSAWHLKNLRSHGIALARFVRAHGRCGGDPGKLLAALRQMSNSQLTLAMVRRWVRQYREVSAERFD